MARLQYFTTFRVTDFAYLTATSTAPTIGTKRRLSSVEVDADAPVGSLSKKSRRGKGAVASDDEGPTSSPITSSPPPPRSSPPPEDVKEVTTGVKEIELGQKSGVQLPEPSEAVEPPVALDTERPVEAEEGVRTDEDATSEQRSGEEGATELGVSEEPEEGDKPTKSPVKPAKQLADDPTDIIDAPSDCAGLSTVDPASPTKVPQSKSSVEEPVAPEDEPEFKA